MHMVDTADTLLITVGILFLIVRRFFWRGIEPANLLRFPLLLVGAGLAWLLWDVANGVSFDLASLGVTGLEAALVCGTGSVMGLMTQFRKSNGRISYRLAPAGVLLWLSFLAIRLGSFVLAGKFGFHLLETTGAILVSFGINRLATAFVIRHKLTLQKSLVATVEHLDSPAVEVPSDMGFSPSPLVH